MNLDRPSKKRSRIWTTVRLLLVLLVVVLLWRGMGYVHAYTISLRRFEVDPGLTKVRSPPSWLTRKDLEDIRRESGLLGRRRPLFTPGLAESFARAYENSPWVKRAVTSRNRYPHYVDVLLEIRKPIAGVLLGEEIVLVSEEGLRLPGTRRSPPAGLGRPLWKLVGVGAPLPEPGRPWSAAVTEGAAVAADLSRHAVTALAARIVEIDVSNVGGRIDSRGSEIVIRTASGARIEWGRSRLSGLSSLEPPVDKKMLLLKRALLIYPGLAGLGTVKLQFDQLYVEEEAGDRDPGG